jgi:transposase
MSSLSELHRFHDTPWKDEVQVGSIERSASGARRYPPELRARAVRMVWEVMEQSGEPFGVITRIARQLDVGSESLRKWVRQAQVDGGARPGTTDEARRVKELEREIRELRRANEILKSAARFFAAELCAM